MKSYKYAAVLLLDMCTAIAINAQVKYEYVDLGLPSGTLWATCNVGASCPENYGCYFAWAETEPKDYYEWSTYKYSKQNTYSKYDVNDKKTVLELCDDAANVCWGGSWRIPTDAEWTELRDSSYCLWTWTTQKCTNGYKVTSKSNGKSIFLPAAGDRYGWGQCLTETIGFYWSSSLYENDPLYAWRMVFDPSTIGRSLSYRCGGRNVRPVCHK